MIVSLYIHSMIVSLYKVDTIIDYVLQWHYHIVILYWHYHSVYLYWSMQSNTIFLFLNIWTQSSIIEERRGSTMLIRFIKSTPCWIPISRNIRVSTRQLQTNRGIQAGSRECQNSLWLCFGFMACLCVPMGLSRFCVFPFC